MKTRGQPAPPYRGVGGGVVAVVKRRVVVAQVAIETKAGGKV